ncbi:MAG: endonuclease MutS2 [Caldisericaceae bacterium]|nr:endonuclease MutS2 [Caldisericaceae bacterium]
MFGFEKAKETLEFDLILDWIAGRCVTDNGKVRLKSNQPFTESSALQQALAEVQDMRDVLQVEGGFPIWNFVDVRVLLNKIEPEASFLEIKEFLELQNFLELTREVIQFRKKMEDKYPSLQNILRQLQATDRLLQQIQFTIDPSGKIFDNASPELKAIRKEIQQIDNEIHIRLERLLKKYAEFLQEEYVTLRDGRFVLPVREFSVNKVPGIVHGQSGSGQTYFVEPMPIVDLNNQLQKLHAAEKKEEIKILKQLSRLTKEFQNELLINYNVLLDLDVLQAKARYANEFHCTAPNINKKFFIELKTAYHPILQKLHPDQVVPLNVHAGDDFNTLIISGPNAGGKTVALKTVGLIQLMFQCGFHVPVAEGSKLPITSQLFTVIGDDQSIENDLSTFSSHIKAIKFILDHVEENSLALIDEIGSGTEPGVGGALAIAILERLNQKGIITLATTHQNQLKVFATETEGVENAAMLFDMEKLTPLFTMEIGIPGSSYTFEICKRLGLDESIIERASEITGKDTFKLDRLLSDLAEKSRKYLQLTREVSIKQSELDSLLELYRIRSETLKKEMKKLDKEAKKRAAQLLADVNKKIEKAIKEIRESQGDRQVIKKARQSIEQLRSELQSEEKKPQEKKIEIAELKAGQKVKSLQFNFEGVISKIFKSKKAVEIDRDGIKITVPIEDIELKGKAVAEKGKIEKSPTVSPVSNISNEVDLRGLTVDEALTELEAFLDKAQLSTWDEIRVIHGKGTGALRQAVHQYLQKSKLVQNFRLGSWGEGDTGVTIVKLKK